MDDVTDIREMYDNNVDREDSRLDRHQLEFDITLRFFEEYIPANSNILEIGSATGKYTLKLAEQGHTITAVDFSKNLLKSCKERVTSAGLEEKVSFIAADARDLSSITKASFDVVLLMGPLYHLVEEEDRKKALKEAYEKLKPGGLIFSALISRYGILGQLIVSQPDWIERRDEVHSILTYGRDPDDSPAGGFRGYFAILSEVTPLHESAGFKKIILAGVEPAISAYDESYNRLTGRQRQLWIDLLYEISNEESMIASSRHLLFIGRKPG
ncbi:MAG: class I SAM-dependent methyltransferase [bacterium]|nr:MAG: class I SAM-dependent methyltransferase [bacterium]